MADPGFANGRAKVERRRREYRGAEGAESGGVWGEGFPLPTGGGVWAGGSATSPEIFFDFRSKKCRLLVHSERYFLQFSYLFYQQETLLLGLQLAAAACMQCTAQRQQKAANTSLLESRNLLQTANLVFPGPIVCSRLSNNINILAKKNSGRQRGGACPPAPWIRHCERSCDE